MRFHIYLSARAIASFDIMVNADFRTVVLSPYSAFAGAVHSLALKEPTHDWREEAAIAASVARKAKASASASQSSTLVPPTSTTTSPVSD